MEHYSVDLPATLRLLLPKPADPTRQSVYIFGMYRSGSSVLEAVSAVMAQMSGLKMINVGRQINMNHMEIQDISAYDRDNAFLLESALDNLCGKGGHLYCGFREIPKSFGDNFSYNAASILLVRDPRDVLMSQYKAVQQHVIENASGEHIKKLRERTSRMSVEEYVTSKGVVDFAKRITNCYANPIRNGTRVFRFEEYATRSDGFNLNGLIGDIHGAIRGYLNIPAPLEEIQKRVATVVADSSHLKGHGTGMKTKAFKTLSDSAQETLWEKLKSELELLGYARS